MFDKYVLKGFSTVHIIRTQTPTFVESVCGAQAHRDRVGSIAHAINPQPCMDCNLLSKSEAQAKRHGRYSPPFAEELE